MVKTIAFYLPQFHEIPENNEWWGKGFTEWTNTKKAKPLYIGHYQPRIPYHNNYYSLADKHVLEQQAELAKKSGLYGFCFYHYWFNGKKLLEKPVEQLLENSDWKFRYCLSWANEPWTRTWDGDKGSKEILMPQEYGGEKEWREHFEYLLPFFKDSRYIRYDGRPVFLIYRAESIVRCKEMLDKWNQWIKEETDIHEGLYFIKMNTIFVESNKDMGFMACCDYEPMRTMREIEKRIPSAFIKKTFLRKLPVFRKWAYPICSYDKIYEEMLKRRKKGTQPCYLGAYVGWDNTARRGELVGRIVDRTSPQKFEKYVRIQRERSEKMRYEFLFINAWNEWAEAAYLEPDERYGYAYLNALKRALK